MNIQHFFDEVTGTVSYVVDDNSIGIVIDPIRNYDSKSARTSWASADSITSYIDDKHLSIEYVIDTHAHADHLSGLPFFKERFARRRLLARAWAQCKKASGIFISSVQIFESMAASSTFFSTRAKRSNPVPWR